jgi:hypothetical protein
MGANLKTEQLASEALQNSEQMSLKDRATARRGLDNAVGATKPSESATGRIHCHQLSTGGCAGNEKARYDRTAVWSNP